ncbi:hypothetical protein [Facklamia hominis]|uniref:hypothetical protein n=1 Tax=Facklamia hominis TaxID=178214 RepID=UPI00101C4F6C|nr:hypothetical protein [Facklamia hominis]RYC97883.1 hypothetical protein EKN08_05875 [Facklamia hominis]
MAYLTTDLSGISIDGDFQELKIGDTVWIETPDLIIKEGLITGFSVKYFEETLTIQYLGYEELEIDVDDIIKIEVQ